MSLTKKECSWQKKESYWRWSCEKMLYTHVEFNFTLNKEISAVVFVNFRNWFENVDCFVTKVSRKFAKPLYYVILPEQNFDNYYLTIERIILVFCNGILIFITIGCFTVNFSAFSAIKFITSWYSNNFILFHWNTRIILCSFYKFQIKQLIKSISFTELHASLYMDKLAFMCSEFDLYEFKTREMVLLAQRK